MSDPLIVPQSSDAPQPQTVEPGTQTSQTLTPALAKFKSCRWRRPIAGTTGFDAEAWCPDCAFYKLRRTPKKRSAEDYRY
jgi:hypothetical protein